MLWPPIKAWTSLSAINGYKYFVAINYGGFGEDRWVNLVSVLDGGFKNAIKFIKKIWGPYFDINEKIIQDSKTKLQELSQKKLKKLPEYNLIRKEGPSHSPLFTVALKVLNLKKIKATGTSIREAEKNAAKIALKILND